MFFVRLINGRITVYSFKRRRLRLAIFEQLNGPIRYDPDRLASLRFNPLLSETYKNLAFLAIMILMLISSRS